MFIDDVPAPGAYRAIILRSPAAKGKLVSVRCPVQIKYYTLITADDVPGDGLLFDGKLPLLARNDVSYIGEPVGLLVGPDILKLEYLAGKCEIEIEEETPEFLIEEAWESKSVFMKVTRESGSPGKDKGELVVEGHYETGIQEHWYSEPHGAIARFKPDGTLSIHTATQRPDDLKREVAGVLGLSESSVTVENAELGIHLDGKVWYPAVISALAALASMRAGKAVKLQLTRSEDYLYSPKRTPSVIHMHSLLTFDGKILETDVLAKIGFGACGVLAKEILDDVATSMSDVYKLGRVTAEAVAVRTNHPPCGPFVGFGASLTAFAIERHLSKITDNLGEEGAQWRYAHLRNRLKIRFEERPENITNNYNDSRASRDILGTVAANSGFKRKWAAYELLRAAGEKEPEHVLPRRGIGIAFTVSKTGDEGAPQNVAAPVNTAPAAACVIEIEIDRINYEAKIRGLWFNVSCGRPAVPEKAEPVLRRAILSALGWTSTEKIKYENGAVMPELCALYQLMPAGEMPPLYIEFAFEENSVSCDAEMLERLPFGSVPAAYTHAISQAIDHHFERIPITGQDVWRVINKKKLEEAEKLSVRAASEASERRTHEASAL